MTDYKATPEQWAQCENWVRSSVVGASDACILELRARTEVLENAAQKHIVETRANILALASRVESLEAAERQASKVHQISKPLKLTPEQAQQVKDLLAPNSKLTPNSSQIGRSLVERVKAVIELEDEKHYWPSPETTKADAWCADMARAVIREVAAWMTSNPDVYFPPALVFALEQEAEQ